MLPPGGTTERDFSWLDFSSNPYLSPDARLMLFSDESVSAGTNYAVCVRKTDGGAVVRLGEGMIFGPSPDARWALAVVYAPPQVVIYPTGPGETRRLPRGGLEAYQSASWYPDGKNILVCGNEPGKAGRCYSQDLSGGSPRPVTPEGSTAGFVSPDATQILYSTQSGAWLIQPAGGGAPRPVPQIAPDESVIRWGADGRSLYLERSSSVPFRFDRLDLGSGRRVLVREVAPADRAGLLFGGGAALTEDLKAYAYDYSRMTSQLYVVEKGR
jgi:Tol biopolymer transport system component